jgi:CheY-like chemotaxis protein
MRSNPLILVVDDEENFLEIISTKLKTSGFDVALAHSAEEAIMESEKLMPDLILMDIRMPLRTGTDAAIAIKQNPKTKNLKVVFLTSMKEPWPGFKGDHKNLSLALGMEDFLEKTDDLDAIVRRITEIIAKK